MRPMAGGTGTGKRRIINTVVKDWPATNYCNQSAIKRQVLSVSDTFVRQQNFQNRRTYITSILSLQKCVLRIFAECLHCDLYIIHSSHVLQTNSCILKARSPKLYRVLEDYFINRETPIKCYIQLPDIFQQVQGFVRLLYCNLDVSREELLLINLIASQRNEYTKTILNSTDNEVDLSRSASEMADSGLETGSFQENTESENSGTDFEESHVTDYISTDDDFIRVSITGDIEKANRRPIDVDSGEKNETTEGETTSSDGYPGTSSARQHQSSMECSSRDNEKETTTCDNADDVSKYENEVLNDVFYESDSNDNDQTPSFVPTGSFEYIEPDATSPNRRTEKYMFDNNPEKSSKSETRSVLAESLCPDLSQTTIDPNLKTSSSSINSYYFIDASSLNDEPDVSSVSITKEETSGMSLPPFLESSYIPTRTIADDKLRKSSHQVGHEKVAEFERELKLTEYLKPDPRKFKRVDSINEGKHEERTIEKESLVVEIKEADSGESNHASPCIDNNKKARENEPMINTDNTSESRRSSLIRGNTFELEAGDAKLSHIRQEYERRQGNLVFKSSIPQYSGHRVDNDLTSSNFSMNYFPETLQTKDFLLSTGPSQSNDQPPDGGYLLTKSVSDKNLAECSETDDSSIADCTSLPATFEQPQPIISRTGTMKRPRRDEMTPIVSGGVSSADYTTLTDSPIVRRKTESTPIVSGGAVLLPTPSEKLTRPTRMSSSMTAWVVDMSDCGKTPSQSTSDMSQSCSSSDCLVRTTASKSKASLGFFVNLKDIDGPKEQKSHSLTPKKADTKQFFVDLSAKEADKPSKKVETNGRVKEAPDKKNIFSMFIDLSDSDTGRSQVKPNRLQARSSDDSGKEGGSESSQESARSVENKKGVFMYIDSDSPVVRRRTLSTSKPVVQRHSWNDKAQANNGQGRKEHKRAHSVSIDPKAIRDQTNATSPRAIEPLHETPKGATGSMETSIEVMDFEIRDTPPNSHIEIITEDLRSSVKCQELKELMRSDMGSSTEASLPDQKAEDEPSDVSVWDKTATESTEGHTRKSETFDISSGSASGPSPGSDNHEFQMPDYRNEHLHQVDIPVASKVSETHKSLTETIKKIEDELEDGYDSRENKTVKQEEAKDSPASCSGFVRLSDLDKTPVKSDLTDTEDLTRITNLSYRMSKSIPAETSWVESKLALNRSSDSCGVRPLSSRKFNSIMSTSLPAKHKSPIDEFGSNDAETEGLISESDLSSMQSSMGRSGADVSTEETETSSFANVKPYNRLGEDLLRMFLEEINPDVTIDVGGRRIRAHKCILSSRCQYFAAILSGGWIESAGNVISLQGYSYSSVHFALCHIYSGENNIPDSISIVELATLADMLCLEGLKEVIGYTLKVKYCHLFHKPCQLCAVGVLECLPLAAAYGLDEVYRKSLRWITRHFVRIWPCKAFATLPRELMDKCYHQHIVHMSADNVLQTVMDCDKLLATLPNVRWAEPVFRMVSNLLEVGLKYLSDNFSSVLSNDSFQALGRDLTWNISRVEDNVLAAADKLPPDQACKSYSKLYKMLANASGDEEHGRTQWNPLFIDFLRKIQGRVEKCLVKDASRAARTTTWLKMDLELRRRIQELACLVILPHEALKRPVRHSSVPKDTKSSAVPRSTGVRSMDLRRVKMTIAEQADKSLKAASISQPTKKPIPKPKSDPLERRMQESKVTTLQAESAVRPKSWPNKLEVKSRYLEPRTKSAPKDSAPPQSLPDKISAQQRRKIMISSSDSSRTSSPAMKRAIDKKPPTKMKLSVKKDIKALSTDSLTECTAAKVPVKKETASKSCGITRPESPSLKAKEVDVGLSADSLATDIKKKPLVVTKKTTRMDTSMSTDSLMTEMTATPKSNVSNKISPTLGRPTAKNAALERAKKASPPMNQKNPLTVVRRPNRSLESSTAASRSRAAATSVYQGSPNLRRNLLDAAKTPDVGSGLVNGVISRVNTRQSTPSTSTPPAFKKDKRDSNPSSSESPSKRSPKMNGINRPTRVVGKKTVKGVEDKVKVKVINADVVKQPTVGSRSGTFLKDEPTILKKSDMKTTQVTS